MNKLVLVGCLAALAATLLQAPESRPNVLFIVTDDMNDDLESFGHPVVRTPHLDRLAQRGMRFERAYSQVPICNPSRVSLLAGLRPEHTGVYTLYTPTRTHLPDAVMLPEYFRKNGYMTVQVGKVYHTGDGFEDPQSWDIEIREFGKSPPDEEILVKGDVAGPRSHTMWWASLKTADQDTPDGFVARKAAGILKDAAGQEKPIFLAVGFRRPHAPFAVPKHYLDMYPQESIELPETPESHLKQIVPGALNYAPPPEPLTDREKREVIAAYYASNTFVDAQIGILFEALDELDLWRNTIVVFFGDHGYHLGDHGGLWHKNSLFERSARVPLIVYSPKMKASGKSTRRLVELLDLYPTLADLSGLPVPEGLDGLSFAPLLDDPAKPWKRAAYTLVARGQEINEHAREVAYLGRSVRTERWRYTEWDEGRRGVELYDHQTDPGELANLAQDPDFAEVRQELKELLQLGR